MAADTEPTTVPTSSQDDPLNAAFEGLIAQQLATVVGLSTRLAELRGQSSVPPLPPVTDQPRS